MTYYIHRKEFAEKHNLPHAKVSKLPVRSMRQLMACKDETAMRLILGNQKRGPTKKHASTDR